MRTTTGAIALMATLAVPTAAQSDRSAATPLSLQAAIDSALRHGPDLLVARSIADSARAETRIARAIPNPVLSAIPNTPFQYAATMPVDIGPQRWGRVRVAELGVAAATADMHESERLLRLGVARLFYDVLLADARRRIVDARREIMRQLVAADSARVRAGDLPERALIRSQVELIRTEADVARAGVEAQTTRLALQGLIGIAHPDGALHLDGDLRYREVAMDTSDAAIAAGRARRPDVAASHTREEQSAAAQRLAATSLVPVPQLSYVRQFGAPFESGRYAALGIGFELPFTNLYAGQRDRAAAGHATADLVRRRVEAQAQREISTALAEFRAQQGLVRRYESGVVEKVEQNVQATRYAYSRGAASLLEVLDALRAQQDVMTDYSTALHDYWVSVYALRAMMSAP